MFCTFFEPFEIAKFLRFENHFWKNQTGESFLYLQTKSKTRLKS